jgi:23S rRNA (guanine745-N1)-methyltransferase
VAAVLTVTPALDRSLRVLACPLCGRPFTRTDGSLRCEQSHSFDIARHGYASLTVGGGPHLRGDTADMVAARSAFLGAGHYGPIADAILLTASSLAADPVPHGWCVELAGGTGYYLARVLDSAPGLDGVSIDVSKPAARIAARAHPRLASVTGDVRAALPISSGSVELVLSVFGPRRGDEVARILTPGGTAIVVTPRPSHLIELRERFELLTIGADKEARLGDAMAPLVLSDSTEVDYTVSLTRDDVVNSIMMGPNAFHHDRAEIEARAAALPAALPTTVSVTISAFRSAPESTLSAD